MASQKPSILDVVDAQLRSVDLVQLVFETEKIAARILAATADRMRDEIGRADCSCGGCDSCVQHALVDWLDPR